MYAKCRILQCSPIIFQAGERYFFCRGRSCWTHTETWNCRLKKWIIIKQNTNKLSTQNTRTNFDYQSSFVEIESFVTFGIVMKENVWPLNNINSFAKLKETKKKSIYYYSVTGTSAATKCSHVQRFTVWFMFLLTNKPTSETIKLKVCGIYALYSEFSFSPQFSSFPTITPFSPVSFVLDGWDKF